MLLRASLAVAVKMRTIKREFRPSVYGFYGSKSRGKFMVSFAGIDLHRDTNRTHKTMIPGF
jgi:hypothetical protein